MVDSLLVAAGQPHPTPKPWYIAVNFTRRDGPYNHCDNHRKVHFDHSQHGRVLITAGPTPLPPSNTKQYIPPPCKPQKEFLRSHGFEPPLCPRRLCCHPLWQEPLGGAGRLCGNWWEWENTTWVPETCWFDRQGVSWNGCGSILNHQGTADFSPWFHLPGLYFLGTYF